MKKIDDSKKEDLRKGCNIMSNVADISNYLLEQFYNESKELKEDILLENGIPGPLYKAYINFNRNDNEKNLNRFLLNKTNNFSND